MKLSKNSEKNRYRHRYNKKRITISRKWYRCIVLIHTNMQKFYEQCIFHKRAVQRNFTEFSNAKNCRKTKGKNLYISYK